nr:hypothetical protein [Novacetimonas pomaceti]
MEAQDRDKVAHDDDSNRHQHDQAPRHAGQEPSSPQPGKTVAPEFHREEQPDLARIKAEFGHQLGGDDRRAQKACIGQPREDRDGDQSAKS